MSMVAPGAVFQPDEIKLIRSTLDEAATMLPQAKRTSAMKVKLASRMDSAQHCKDQVAECLRLVKLAQNKDQAEVLRNLSSSWSRLAGQIDRYDALVREQGRIVRK
jgi:hypothetical protein